MAVEKIFAKLAFWRRNTFGIRTVEQKKAKPVQDTIVLERRDKLGKDL